MGSLEPPDVHWLRAASGWLDLGNANEAAAELRRLSSAARQHPDVLEEQWRLEALEHRWDEASRTASQLVKAAPEKASGYLHRAYALHELGQTREAYTLLRPAAQRFRKIVTIPYNLACYACQLGHLDEARKWLARAVRARGPEAIAELALSDSDLEPMWPEIRAWDTESKTLDEPPEEG